MADKDQDVTVLKQHIRVDGQWIRIEGSDNANHAGANVQQAQSVQQGQGADAKIHLTGAGGFDVANIADCAGCTCVSAVDLPFFPDRIGNIANQRGLAQIEIQIAEVEGGAHGLTQHYMHEFINGKMLDERGSIREHALYLEFQPLGQHAIELLLTAKNAELKELETLYQRVYSFQQAPDVGVCTSIDGAEQEFDVQFKNVGFLQTKYNMTPETFDVIYQSAKHLGLSNMDIHEYLLTGKSARKRGPLQVWAVKRRAEGMSQEQRLAEINKRKLEITVLLRVGQANLNQAFRNGHPQN